MKRFITIGLVIFFISLVFYTKASASEVVYISQVQITGGTGKTEQDFVELFNPGLVPVNLKGYRLVKRSANGTADTLIKSWTSDTFIPAHGFYLWANTNFTGISQAPDTTTTGTISNDNGVALRQGASDSGVIVDSLAWGTTSNIFRNVSGVNPVAGQALARKDLYTEGSIFEIKAASPRNSTITDGPPIVVIPPAPITTTTTPTSTLDSAGGKIYLSKSANIKITEILANPSDEDSGKEAVELENIGDDPVELNGWFLGDESEGGGPKPNVFTVPDQSILPGAQSVITIPSGYFTLNNSGDSVNLYFADKSLADSVNYKDDAPEGQSYQKINEAWVWAAPSLGRINFANSAKLASEFVVYMNEIMPNPAGSDEGKEWVEIYNSSDEAVNLSGFLLDDQGKDFGPSANAWELDETAIVAPKSFLLLTIPEDKFALLNSGGAVRLFDPQCSQIGLAYYGTAEEDLSFSRQGDEGAWGFGQSSPGSSNILASPEAQIVISEIYPNPKPGEQEFLELKNLGESEINLKNWDVIVGDRKQKIGKDIVIPAEGFAVLYQDFLTAQLRNSGQEIIINDPAGRLMDKSSYPAMDSGQVYIQTVPGNWVIGGSPTPGAANGEVLAAVTLEPASAVSNKTSAKAKISVSSVKKTSSKDEQDLSEQVAELKNIVAELKGSLPVTVQAAQAGGINEADGSSSDLENKNDGMAGLGLSLGALALLMVIVRLFSKKDKKTSVS